MSSRFLIIFIALQTLSCSKGSSGDTGSASVITVTGPITNISTSATTSCAVRGGYVKCWGGNSNGQIGDSTTNARLTATLAVGISNITKVQTDGMKTCARSSSNKLYCWGKYDYSTNQTSPVLISELNNVTDFAVGGFGKVCAIDTGLLYCWGFWSGSVSNTPTLVPGLINVNLIVIGWGGYCAQSGTKLFCAGNNSDGFFGNGASSGVYSTPIDLSAYWYSSSQLSFSTFTLCNISSSGSVRCAGDNGGGQVYSEPSVSLVSPLTSPTLPYNLIGSATVVAAGNRHTCVLMGSSTIKCWGSNSSYALGINSTSNLLYQPSNVVGISANVVALAAGQNTTCAALDDQTAVCWGDNSNGQIGNGNTLNQSIPVKVQGL